MKVEKSTLWEEDTEKNLDKSENVSQIFTSDFSNSDSPNDDPDSQTENDFGTNSPIYYSSAEKTCECAILDFFWMALDNSTDN